MSSRTLSTLALASALSAVVGVVSTASAFDAAKEEQCFGIALKGQNDCAAAGVHDCAGMSKVDFEGGSWKAVPKGTCLSMNVKGHKGSLTPIKT